jgi:hypothetical protein
MDYRVYMLNEEGHIVSARELECAGDDEAKSIAARLVDGHMSNCGSEIDGLPF